MESDLSAHPPRDDAVYESVELLRGQIKEIEDKWNDQLKRLETARKDKEELEEILRVLRAFVEYEREATLKMDAMLQETRDALGVRTEATPERAYDPSESRGSSSSGGSSVLEFDLVYNPNAALKFPLGPPSVSTQPSLPDADDQPITVPPLLSTPTKPAKKAKFSPNWKSRITSILVSINNHGRTNPPSSSSARSLDSATPFFHDAESHNPKPPRVAKYRERPSLDSENHGTVSWKRTVGSVGSKFANRANLDINRRKPRDVA